MDMSTPSEVRWRTSPPGPISCLLSLCSEVNPRNRLIDFQDHKHKYVRNHKYKQKPYEKTVNTNRNNTNRNIKYKQQPGEKTINTDRNNDSMRKLWG